MAGERNNLLGIVAVLGAGQGGGIGPRARVVRRRPLIRYFFPGHGDVMEGAFKERFRSPAECRAECRAECSASGSSAGFNAGYSTGTGGVGKTRLRLGRMHKGAPCAWMAGISWLWRLLSTYKPWWHQRPEHAVSLSAKLMIASLGQSP